ncbi:MAG: hypothetical protein ACFFBD_08645 [Candidatus Hodarchaeota archaeon]
MSKQHVERWRVLPLEVAIITILEHQGDLLLDKDLMRFLSKEKELGDIGENEVNNALMNLEIEGLVHVQEIKKGVRRIVKIKDQDFLAVGED